MTEGRGFHKFALAFVQSLPVLVVAYLFSFVERQKSTLIQFSICIYCIS